jgi:hypothetical protein
LLGFIWLAGVVRQVPDIQPSPVVSFTTVREEMTRLPASRGSLLVAVPRQTAFVIRNVFPFRVHVRLCERAWSAVNEADTSCVDGLVCVAAATPPITIRPTATNSERYR